MEPVACFSQSHLLSLDMLFVASLLHQVRILVLLVVFSKIVKLLPKRGYYGVYKFVQAERDKDKSTQAPYCAKISQKRSNMNLQMQQVYDEGKGNC